MAMPVPANWKTLRKRCSLRRNASSAALRSEMSSMMATKPSGAPDVSRRAEPDMFTNTMEPSRRR